MKFEIISGHCLEMMQKMEDNSVDSIIADPPTSGFGLNGRPHEYWKSFHPYFDEIVRLCRERKKVAISAHPIGFTYLSQKMNLPEKLTLPNAFSDQRGEDAWFAISEPPLDKSEMNQQVWNTQLIPETIHPNARDVRLMAQLVHQITDEGDTVLDPFCGSGATGIACLLLNRNFVGMELKKARADDARNRLESVIQFKEQILSK